MAAMLSTYTFSSGVNGLNYKCSKSNTDSYKKDVNQRLFFSPSSRLLPTSSTRWLRNLSSQHQGKPSPQRITRSANLQSNGDENIIPEKASSPTKELKTTNSEAFESDMLTSVSSSSNTAQDTAKENENLTEDGLEAEDEKSLPPAGDNVMNIIFVTAECAPWSKTGGLGYVAGSLPKALARRGHRVMVLTPRYGDIAEGKDSGVRKMFNLNDQEVTYFHTYIDGVDFVFINSNMFRSNIYGGHRLDILRRMILFCKAAVEVPLHVPCGGVCYGDLNLVFIANDWHTALVPLYLKVYYRDGNLMRFARSVLAIHNIAHQGRWPTNEFSLIELPEEYKYLLELYDPWPVDHEHLNILAAGLRTADRVVIVSHGFAWEYRYFEGNFGRPGVYDIDWREICREDPTCRFGTFSGYAGGLKTLQGGLGLPELMTGCDWKLSGIVNGIDELDTKEWNPQVDVYLKSDGYTNYSIETLQFGKAQCKAALQKELGLPIRRDVPLIGFIGSLEDQKGVFSIVASIPWMVGEDAQVVVLGAGTAILEKMVTDFECQYPNNVRNWVGLSVKRAHRITAGADILLMPTESGRLNQLYAMRYGTLGVGGTFDIGPDMVTSSLRTSLFTFHKMPREWRQVQRLAMTQDLSLEKVAQKYEEVLIAAKYKW